MGAADVLARRYMSNPKRFADAFNYAIYGGEQVIKANELAELDSVSVTGSQKRSGKGIERRRDGLKAWQMMRDNHGTYALLGVENQTYVDAAMPVRCMLYDAMGYSDQVDVLKRENRSDGTLKGKEWLSGLKKTDRLLPIVTLVIQFGGDEWTVPRSIYELLVGGDSRLQEFVPDYRINILSPAAIENGDFAKFKTELGLVLGYIKNSGDKDALRELMKGDGRYHNVSAESVELINVVTDSGLEIGSGEERVDMCQAIRDIRQEGMDEGMKQGMVRTLGDLVRDGVLTLAEASARAGLTTEEFKARLAELSASST